MEVHFHSKDMVDKNFPNTNRAPLSMIGTFAIVLIFTMLKEAFEDIQRHKQDRDLNNKESLVFDLMQLKFVKRKWHEIKSGELIKVLKDEEFPADMVFLKSDKQTGIAFTNLKEKVAPKDVLKLEIAHLLQMSGILTCDSPNEYLDRWDGNITTQLQGKQLVFNTSLKTLLLRGCTLRNTEFAIGIAVYTGPESKIMMNAKKPPTKISNVQRKMNQMLYSVFAFQLILILIYAILSVFWIKNKAPTHYYLSLGKDPGFGDFIIQYLTYWIYDKDTGFSLCRNSDLIEEMGQVEFIFSDKTGTLTCNIMEFKQCSINGKIYKSLDEAKRLFQNSNQSNKDLQDIQACHEFFRFMAVCHTVVLDQDKKTGQQKMQASSPDELALVQGSVDVGFKFVERTPQFIKIEIEYLKNRAEKYNIVTEFPFDSTRKRMSLIVKEEKSGKLYLMTKGADSIMLPRTNLQVKQKKVIEDHLYKFACSGLRTLVMAQKDLNEQDYKAWNKKYQQTMVSNDPKKDDMLNQLYDEMETDLKYIGSSAIEDLLQDQVPETIQNLMNAGIKVWVLTGDKQETAIEIGKSCNLINQSTMELIILSSKDREEFMKKLTDAETQKSKFEKKSIVIDGQTLAIVLEDNSTSQRFFKFGCTANSVICCRVSPKQKSDVVALAKRNGTWITLSVGDGANDVPMIMEAHIGVGIRGKEGTQAVRSADYAIGQFRFLQKLIMAHGRWGYRRVAIFICYYFYKNVILVFCEIYFAFFNGYSGQIYFADWLPMLYNVFWTSWPCIFTFIFDRDIDGDASIRSPDLYSAGPQHIYFNFKVFWKWMGLALFHGWVCYFIPQLGYKGIINEKGIEDSHWFVSTISFTLLIVPVIALLPDLTMMFVFRVFYKSPADVGMLKLKDKGQTRRNYYKNEKAKLGPDSEFNNSSNDIEKVPLKKDLNETSVQKISHSKAKSHSLKITAPNDKNSTDSSPQKKSSGKKDGDENKDFFKKQLEKMKQLKTFAQPTPSQNVLSLQTGSNMITQVTPSPTNEFEIGPGEPKKKKFKSHRPGQKDTKGRQIDTDSDIYNVYDFRPNNGGNDTTNISSGSISHNVGVHLQNRLLNKQKLQTQKKNTDEFDIDAIAKELNLR
ncbi:p-type atpase [Stylonychia lemnae]|uniref:Phospholipid-transporting ATPase n=1 Tax=Stylonychia lemnae TaxID=5949 RepID=A0A078B0S3_STYLE|nr:p-type atpase [Stylonychia lemnae]|eukprot:CDW88154.1 p-type atpase [Stylonychia lemnae]